MAGRIWTSGFEGGDTLLWDYQAPTLSTSATYVHTGTYCGYNGRRGVPAGAEFYTRIWVKASSFVNEPVITGFYNNGTDLIRVRFNDNNNRLSIYIGSTKVADGTKPVLPLTFYMIEVHAVLDNSSGVVEVKIDGVDDVSFSGDTNPSTTITTINNISSGLQAAAGGICYSDDMAVADDTWIGDGRVIAIMPNANGDKSDMVGSDSDSTDNYALVDEIPNDGDTTYVQTDTIGNYDLYNLGACGLSNVDILRVWVEAVAKETEVAGGKIALGIKPSGGTESWGSDKDLLTSYVRFAGTEHTVNPATSAAWTTGEVDGLQAGVKATA